MNPKPYNLKLDPEPPIRKPLIPNTEPWSLNPKREALNYLSYALYIMNTQSPEPKTLNPKVYPLNPTLYIPHPISYILNTQPGTLISES